MKRSIMIALIGLLISFNSVQLFAGMCPSCKSIEARKVKLIEDLHCAKPYIAKIAMDFTYITAFCLFFLHHARSGDKFLSLRTILLATAYAIGAVIVKNSLKCFANDNKNMIEPSCIHTQAIAESMPSVVPEETQMVTPEQIAQVNEVAIEPVVEPAPEKAAEEVVAPEVVSEPCVECEVQATPEVTEVTEAVA